MKRKLLKIIGMTMLSLTLVSCNNIEPKNLEIKEVEINSKEEEGLFSKKYLVNDNTLILGELEGDNLLVMELNKGDNQLYKLSLKDGKSEGYLNTIKKENTFRGVYVFNKEYLVWVEGDKDKKVANHYTVGLKDLKSGDVFTIMEDENKGQNFFEPPTKFSYSNGVIAYKYTEIDGDKSVGVVESCNLKTKERRVHYKSKDYSLTSVSDADILNGKIVYTEITNEGENKNSKIFYHDISEDKKVFVERNNEPYLIGPRLADGYIYMEEFTPTAEKGLVKYSISRFNLANKERELLFNEETIAKSGINTMIDGKGGTPLSIVDINKENFWFSTNGFEDLIYNFDKKEFKEYLDRGIYGRDSRISMISDDYVFINVFGMDEGLGYLYKVKK